MGSCFSIPLAQPPFIFDFPESRIKVEEEADDVFAESHADNVKICETMYRQNARSKTEEAMFNVYRRNWSKVVETLMEKYPQWTSKDILNLSNDLLDFFQHPSSPEQRKEMFDSIDTHRYKAVNFEEYLQLMSNMNIRSPVPKADRIDKDKDEIMILCSDVSETHVFKQMCYGLF